MEHCRHLTDGRIHTQRDLFKGISEKASCPGWVMARSLCHPLELKSVCVGRVQSGPLSPSNGHTKGIEEVFLVPMIY